MAPLRHPTMSVLRPLLGVNRTLPFVQWLRLYGPAAVFSDAFFTATIVSAPRDKSGFRERDRFYLCTFREVIRQLGRRLARRCWRSIVGAAARAIVQLPREEVACAMVQERPGRVERRLSAILAADVAGYSRLMHNDEEATHARLTMLLTEAVEPSIAQHGGPVVKNTGDGLLSEFRSAVEADRDGTQLQGRAHDLTIVAAVEKRLAIHGGIHTC